MSTKKIGAQTMAFAAPPSFLGFANIVGTKEGSGPLSEHFDVIAEKDDFGQSSWEKAESFMQEKALELALRKAELSASGLEYLFAGDLLNQCISSAYAARSQDVPFFGLYGACSTMGEGIILASMAIDGGYADRTAAVVSSHFCTAERQYRTPLEYGSQRTPTAQWTVTGAGAAILGTIGPGPYVTHCTVGKVIDKGITDTSNMGAAMAPSAYETLTAHFADTGRSPDFYDLILTGDLGQLGRELLLELFRRDGIDLSPNHNDCGILIYDPEGQDVHCGGSGCGCSASVLTGYLLGGMRAGVWKNVLFCPTGSLHSPTAAFQGESLPGICHAVAISAALPV